jgi:hypothetical protein
MSTSVRLMAQGCAAAIFTQGLAFLVASAAAPLAFADAVEYPRPPANASRGAGSTANDAQIAAANRNADQALAMAERALREAQRAPTSRESAPASGTSTRERLRPIVDGHHIHPRRDDVCDLLPASSDCWGGNADGVDSDLFREILRRAAA